MPTALTSLLPLVNVKAKMVPEPLALFVLRDAAAEFCRQTGIVTEILPDITLVAGTAEYPLVSATPDYYRGVKALDVWLDGAEITPRTASQLKDSFGNWTPHTGVPRHYTQLTEGTLRLYPVPEAAGTLVVRAATAPALTATHIDDALADRWWKAIVAGALSALFDMEDEPFYKPDASAKQLGIFNAYVDEAKHAASVGYTRARLRTTAHRY